MRDAPEILQLVSAGVVPCVAYLAVGLRLLPRLGIEPRGAERLALGYVFGTGVCSLGILLLRAAGIPVPLLLAGVVAVLAWPLRGRGLQRGAAQAPAPVAVAAEAGWVRAVGVATAAVAALTCVAALAPETAWDGFEYHLPLVAAWTEAPIRAVPGMIDAEFRAGVELLYVPAVTSGFPDAAAAVSAGFALALAALVRAEAARRAGSGAGALAAFFTLVVPFTTDFAPTTYVDLAVGAYGFAALLFADRWNRAAEPPALRGCALCCAFAANAKLHAAILCPAVLVIVLLGGRRPAWSAVARSAGLVALLMAPWWVKTALTTGNPFFPLLGGWLGTGPTDARHLELRKLRSLANYPAPRNPLGLAQYLVSIHFGRNLHVSGLLGPLPLALAPLAWRCPTRATLVLVGTGAVLVVLQFFTLPALRFGAPLWPWLAVAAAVGGRRLAASGRLAQLVLAAALSLLALHHVVVMGMRYLPRVAALREPRAYEREMFPDQDNLRRLVGQAEPVVGIPMGAVSWMPRPVYNLLWERNGELYFVKGTPPDRALSLLRERGVRSLVLDVAPPHPEDGRTGHAIVDAWLAGGQAALAPDVEPLPARPPRRWTLIRLSP